jgi:hypothetical protein
MGRFVSRAIQVTAPVRPIASHSAPVKSPDAQIALGEMDPGWPMAAVPIAFMGWIGRGVWK